MPSAIGIGIEHFYRSFDQFQRVCGLTLPGQQLCPAQAGQGSMFRFQPIGVMNVLIGGR